MRHICIAAVILLLLIPRGIQASQALPPLYATLHNTLVSWTSEKGAVPASKWDYNQQPAASADGRHIAFGIEDELTVKAYKAKYGADTALEGDLEFWRDIALLDTRNNSVVVLAGQPKGDGASLPESNVARSDPSWSPDGKALAWMEFTYKTHFDVTPLDAQLVIYNLESASLAHYPVTVQNTGSPPWLQTRWGQTGIAVVSIFNEGIGDLYTFDGAGKQLAYHALGFEQTFGESEIVNDPIWLNDGQKEYLGSVTYPYMLDVIPDKGINFTGKIELYNPLAPNGLRISITTQDYSPVWQIVDANGRTVYTPEPPYLVTDVMHNFGLAPDGQHIAFLASADNQLRVMIYYNGQVTPAFDDSVVPPAFDFPHSRNGITWGPLTWYLRYSVSM